MAGKRHGDAVVASHRKANVETEHEVLQRLLVEQVAPLLLHANDRTVHSFIPFDGADPAVEVFAVEDALKAFFRRRCGSSPDTAPTVNMKQQVTAAKTFTIRFIGLDLKTSESEAGWLRSRQRTHD
ncbi:MAG: hypothetical protein QM775_03030 [Pirellulales bacterium]